MHVSGNLSRPRGRGGLLLAEMGVGLAIVAAVAGALVVVMTRQQRGSQQLADHRAAIRMAETALAVLRTDRPIVPSSDLSVERLQDPSPLTGRTWVTVRATVNGRSTTLTGLVSARAVEQAGHAATTQEAR